MAPAPPDAGSGIDRAQAPPGVVPPPRLTVRRVVGDAYRDIVSLDAPVLRTWKRLTLRPGAFVRGYLRLDRSGVVGPVKYALLSVTLLVLLSQVRRAFFPPATLPGADARFTSAFYAAQDLRAYLVLLALLPTSLVQWLLFRREEFNYAETFAFAAFVFGHMVWLNILRLLLPASSFLDPVVQVVYAAFLTWAVCGFYRRLTPSVVLRALAVYGAFSLAMLVVLKAAIDWRLGR